MKTKVKFVYFFGFAFFDEPEIIKVGAHWQKTPQISPRNFRTFNIFVLELSRFEQSVSWSAIYRDQTLPERSLDV
jgi:hypothetical protein